MIQNPSSAPSSRSLLGSGSSLAICAAIVASLGLLYAIPSGENPAAEARSTRVAEATTTAIIAETETPVERLQAMDLMQYEVKVVDEPVASPALGSRETEIASAPEEARIAILPPSEPKASEPHPETKVISQTPAAEVLPEVSGAAPATASSHATPDRKRTPKVARKEPRPNRKAPSVDWRQTADTFLGCSSGGCDTGDIARYVYSITSRF